MKPPLHKILGNVLIGPDATAALYRVETIAFEYLSESEKHGQLSAWSSFAYHVGADFSVHRVARAYAADRYVADASSLLDARHADPAAWERHLRGHERRLEALRCWEPEIYVSVRLDAGRRRRFSAEDEEAARSTIATYLPARRATTLEIQWLLRRATYRGLPEPELDPHWRPAAFELEGARWEPRHRELLRFTNAALTEEARGVTVDTEHGRSHQAMLALGALPEHSDFPGSAELLFRPLEGVGFPVDAVAHVQWVPNDEMHKAVRKRVIDADVAADEQAHRMLSRIPERNRIMARDVEEYYGSEPYPPGLRVSILLALGAPDLAERETRVSALRKRYGALKLERPLGLQAALYADHLPRPDGGRVRDYADILTLEQFGALTPQGTHAAGSKRGVYFAHTLTGKRPVLVDVTEASRTNRAPSVLLVGTLGSGKTFAAQLLVLHAALRGSLVVDVDPRPDHNLEGLPQLHGAVHVIELSGDECNRGLLDPLAVAPPALREDLAAAYLTEILPQAPPSWVTQIRKAVKHQLTLPAPSCLAVVDWLGASENPDARRAGEALEVWSDSGLGRMAFGAPGDVAVTQAQRQVTTIKAAGLTLPPPGVPRADYDQTERMGAATLRLLVGYAMRLVSGDRSVHKVIHFDEAHVLLGTGDGRRFLDRINRMGRSMNATLLLSTQLLGDVAELEALIGSRLIFGQETEAQARAVLPILGLDPSDDALVKLLCGFRRGQCLYRGIDGRVTAMQVDSVEPGLLDALDTSPRAAPVLA